jgi:hypothetical protein
LLRFPVGTPVAADKHWESALKWRAAASFTRSPICHS